MIRLYSRVMHGVEAGVRGILVHQTPHAECFGPDCEFMDTDCGVYACRTHQCVHMCGGVNRCELARPGRDAVCCPVSGNTWQLQFDTWAQRVGSRRCEFGESDGGDADGGDADGALRDPGGGGGYDVDEEEEEEGEEAEERGRGRGCVDDLVAGDRAIDQPASNGVVDDSVGYSGYIASREGGTSSLSRRPVHESEMAANFRLRVEAEEILQLIARGPKRLEINARKRARYIGNFHMAVRRYAQKATTDGVCLDAWVIIRLHGMTIDSVNRYTDTVLGDAERDSMAESAVTLWNRLSGVDRVIPGGLIADRSYVFRFHCLVVFMLMRTGYSIGGICIIPRTPCAIGAIPTPRDMNQIGFAERRITQHTHMFASMCASLVRRCGSGPMA